MKQLVKRYNDVISREEHTISSDVCDQGRNVYYILLYLSKPTFSFQTAGYALRWFHTHSPNCKINRSLDPRPYDQNIWPIEASVNRADSRIVECACNQRTTWPAVWNLKIGYGKNIQRCTFELLLNEKGWLYYYQRTHISKLNLKSMLWLHLYFAYMEMYSINVFHYCHLYMCFHCFSIMFKCSFDNSHL